MARKLGADEFVAKPLATQWVRALQARLDER